MVLKVTVPVSGYGYAPFAMYEMIENGYKIYIIADVANKVSCSLSGVALT
jgi:hypothetical protein